MRRGVCLEAAAAGRPTAAAAAAAYDPPADLTLWLAAGMEPVLPAAGLDLLLSVMSLLAALLAWPSPAVLTGPAVVDLLPRWLADMGTSETCACCPGPSTACAFCGDLRLPALLRLLSGVACFLGTLGLVVVLTVD